MQDDDLRPSSNIEDRRGQPGGGGGFTVGRGGLGIGAIIVLSLIGWATGIDPRVLIGGAEVVTGGGQPAGQYAPRQPQQQVQSGTPTDAAGTFVAKILGETEDVWSAELPRQANVQYVRPVLVLFSGRTESGCGTAQAASGPFYCPLDRKLYLDTAFFAEMQQRFGGGGEFAYAYVISHEVGHHVQNLLGLLPKVQAAERDAQDPAVAKNLSVRTELMADCLAGVWANKMNERHANLDGNDIQQAARTASSIGDDRIARESGRAVVPDSFTHGTSEQRGRWLGTGLQQGTIAACNTFQGAI
ncbi:MAG: KPN_02809 family neutral zinc metallopeptidase [Janthinobacterium lividum]